MAANEVPGIFGGKLSIGGTLVTLFYEDETEEESKIDRTLLKERLGLEPSCRVGLFMLQNNGDGVVRIIKKHAVYFNLAKLKKALNQEAGS